jgi:hypothetical protein
VSSCVAEDLFGQGVKRRIAFELGDTMFNYGEGLLLLMDHLSAKKLDGEVVLGGELAGKATEIGAAAELDDSFADALGVTLLIDHELVKGCAEMLVAGSPPRPGVGQISGQRTAEDL